MHTHDEIRKIAHDLYEKSGCQNGRCLDNWLEAERIVHARQDSSAQPADPATESSEEAPEATPEQTPAEDPVPVAPAPAAVAEEKAEVEVEVEVKAEVKAEEKKPVIRRTRTTKTPAVKTTAKTAAKTTGKTGTKTAPQRRRGTKSKDTE